MIPCRKHLGNITRIAMAAIAALAIAAGCSSGDKAGPPVLPSGIDRAVVAVHYMSGPVEKTTTDPDDIAALREAVNRLPRPGNGPRKCVTDQGSWTLTLTGQGRRITMTFDHSGCNMVRVHTENGATSTRQGNEQLRTELTGLIS